MSIAFYLCLVLALVNITLCAMNNGDSGFFVTAQVWLASAMVVNQL